MAILEDFHANGVSFPESPRSDVSMLVEEVPGQGTLHLAILQPPYLDLIDKGIKTVESRFNTKRAAPFGKVAVGDLVLLKQTGRPITNYFFVAAATSLDLSQIPIGYVRGHYGVGIQAQDEEAFWRERATSQYATLIEIGERGAVMPFSVIKKDQRGWVTFARDSETEPTLF